MEPGPAELTFLDRTESTWAHVGPSQPGPRSSWVIPNPCRDESAHSQAEPSRAHLGGVESTRTEVKSSWPRPRSTQVRSISGRVESASYQVEAAWVHVKPSQLGPISSHVSPSLGQPESAWAQVELSRL